MNVGCQTTFNTAQNSARRCRIVSVCFILAAWVSTASGRVESGVDATTPTGDDTCSAIELSPDLLRTIEHRTLRVQTEERKAYYTALQQAVETRYEKQQACAERFLLERRQELPDLQEHPDREFPIFVDLFKNPDRYHGKPVTLTGHVRKLSSMPAGENELGFETLYEAWLFTDDSQSNPAVVVSASIPQGMPLGDNLVEQVSVTGYFFKMYAYPARDTTRVAPLLLAQRLRWHPLESVRDRTEAPPFLYVVVAIILAGLVLFVWRSGRNDRKLRELHAVLRPDSLQPGLDSHSPPVETDASAEARETLDHSSHDRAATKPEETGRAPRGGSDVKG